MAGAEGFEPPILVPETSALPLGDAPMCYTDIHYGNFASNQAESVIA